MTKELLGSLIQNATFNPGWLFELGGGYSVGVLIKYCSVQVARTGIFNNLTLVLFTLTGPKSNAMHLQCQLVIINISQKKFQNKK